tara:strand:- start:721 stop:903 length:183 start_codon:yes stop_codon:yes gene_type:complete
MKKIKRQKYLIPCPNCGSWGNIEYVDLRDLNGKVSVMCWDSCGMDFDVSGIWFMLNRLEV